MNSSPQLTIALSWRFITEFWRRFPKRFVLIEAHPGGGGGDCLTLLTNDQERRWTLDVNRGGSVHVTPLNGQSKTYPEWQERMLQDPQAFIDQISRELSLHAPSKLPPSTPETIVYRFISDFMTHAVGRLEKWDCRNGFEDSSGFLGCSVRDEWFELFPELPKRPKAEDAKAYWFLLLDQKPKLCFHTSGIAITRNGTTTNLSEHYKQHKRIWPVIQKGAGDLLP